MYILLSFFLGILLKLYDDIIDLDLIHKYNINIVYIEIIKYLIIYFSILLGLYNYINTIIIFIALLASNFAKPFDDVFWINFTITIFLFNLLFINQIKNIFVYFYVKLLSIIIIILLITFEEKTFIEEYSDLKYKSRFINIFVNTFILCILDFFNIIKKYNLVYLRPFIIFVNSYFMTSLFIQSLKIL